MPEPNALIEAIKLRAVFGYADAELAQDDVALLMEDRERLLAVVEAAKRWRAHQWQSSGHAKMDAALIAAVDALAPQEQTP